MKVSGGTFYYIAINGKTCEFSIHSFSVASWRYRMSIKENNVFSTTEAAQEALDKIRAILRGDDDMKVKQSTPKAAVIRIELTVDEAMGIYSAISGEALVDNESAEAAKNDLVVAMKDELEL